jgi:hypothetical protein
MFAAPTSKPLRTEKTSEQYQLKYATKKGEVWNLALYEYLYFLYVVAFFCLLR